MTWLRGRATDPRLDLGPSGPFESRFAGLIDRSFQSDDEAVENVRSRVLDAFVQHASATTPSRFGRPATARPGFGRPARRGLAGVLAVSASLVAFGAVAIAAEPGAPLYQVRLQVEFGDPPVGRRTGRVAGAARSTPTADRRGRRWRSPLRLRGPRRCPRRIPRRADRACRAVGGSRPEGGPAHGRRSRSAGGRRPGSSPSERDRRPRPRCDPGRLRDDRSRLRRRRGPSRRSPCGWGHREPARRRDDRRSRTPMASTGDPHADGTTGDPHADGTTGDPHAGGATGNPHADGTTGNPHPGGTTGNPHGDGTTGNPHPGGSGQSKGKPPVKTGKPSN